ncbi:S41 family peptidase [Pontibacter roseus]|uniref:S41 family peptidase n=1 Tax=Pontibacter roseus TaxID=336989 RepID=UPI00036A2708|nr:S41 family peptidase [Pontibacter roseus]
MKILFLTGFLLLLSQGLLQAQPKVLSVAQWQADVTALAEQLPKMHREPFNKVSRQAFDSAVAVLHTRVPQLQDHEIIVGLAGLVAMIGDGHTRLTLPQDAAVAYSRAHSTTPPPADSSLYLNHLPVKLALFDDGLFIKETTPEMLYLVGAQVLQIGATPAAEALEKVRPVTHYDNEMGFKLLAPTFLVVPEFLAALGIADDVEQVTFKIKTREGAVEDIVLSPIPLFKKQYFVGAPEALGIEPPLSQRNLKNKYWLHVLEEEQTLYVQVNELYNKEEESVAAFVAKIERIVAGGQVKKLVLDLRHNPGGSNSFNRPIVLALARSARINQFGGLYTLIGRETFSAAQMLANDLEYYTNTLFVGEPSGSSPSAYGDSRKMQLPNSKLTVRVSTIYWRDWNGDEKRPWTAPDIPVAYTSGDYLKGRDPALEAVLDMPLETSITKTIQQVYERAGFDQALWVYARFALDPRTDQEMVEPVEKEFGAYLLHLEKAEEAAGWYGYMGTLHKEAVWPMLGLAQAHLLSKEPQKAKAILEKAIQLEPANKQAKALLAAIRKGQSRG